MTNTFLLVHVPLLFLGDAAGWSRRQPGSPSAGGPPLHPSTVPGTDQQPAVLRRDPRTLFPRGAGTAPVPDQGPGLGRRLQRDTDQLLCFT